MKRKEVIESVMTRFPNALFITSCGLISRDAYSLNENILPLTGSMGMVLPLSVGLALSKPARLVIAVVGDGEYMMGFSVLNNMANIKDSLSNLVHIVIVDGNYQSTGGQKNAWNMEITANMLAQVYKTFFISLDIGNFEYLLNHCEGLSVILAYVAPDSEKSPRIPDEKLKEWKKVIN